MKPHKWKDVIIAYANGKAIQSRLYAVGEDGQAYSITPWTDTDTPTFQTTGVEYRVKPDIKKVKRCLYVFELPRGEHATNVYIDNPNVEYTMVDGRLAYVKWIGDPYIEDDCCDVKCDTSSENHYD